MKILIMAGGSGERFWPLSTKERPKQLLPLITGKSMIRETVDRVLKIVSPKDIYIATNMIQAELIKKEISDIPERNIIIEPAFKDTAAAIAYGSTIIARDYPDPVISVLASDHLIKDVDEFLKMLSLAEKEAVKGSIITLGINPTKPETGYGYIQLDCKKIGVVSKAKRFMEKPNYETAEEYIDNGNYVWNSGMFVFQYDTIMKEIKKYIPNHYLVIQKMKTVMLDYSGSKLSLITKPFFSEFEKISIDFAVMEKSQIIKCIPVNFGWNDVGGFNSLEEVFIKDNNSNVIRGCNYISVDSKNNIIISDKKNRLITSIGVEDMIIVDTEDALLVCKKSDSQRIKELLKKLI